MYTHRNSDRWSLTEVRFYIPNIAYSLLQELVLQTTHPFTLMDFEFIWALACLIVSSFTNKKQLSDKRRQPIKMQQYTFYYNYLHSFGESYTLI